METTDRKIQVRGEKLKNCMREKAIGEKERERGGQKRKRKKVGKKKGERKRIKQEKNERKEEKKM